MKQNNVLAARKIGPATNYAGKKARKKESKSAQKRKAREKIKFWLFFSLFLPAAMFGAELSLMKHPATTKGTVQSIDIAAHTLSFTTAQQPEPIVVQWLDTTEFYIDGVISDAEKIQPRMKVTVLTKESLVFSYRPFEIRAFSIKETSTDAK